MHTDEVAEIFWEPPDFAVFGFLDYYSHLCDVVDCTCHEYEVSIFYLDEVENVMNLCLECLQVFGSSF